MGAQKLHDTAQLFDIPAGEIPELKKMMPFAAYGQGPVLVSPFKMARQEGDDQRRWRDAARALIIDETNPEEQNCRVQSRRRSPLYSWRIPCGSGNRRHGADRVMAGIGVTVAGKTGTAQLDQGQPHSWFAGFAPYEGDPSRRIAFAVVVEHGGYGSSIGGALDRTRDYRGFARAATIDKR